MIRHKFLAAATAAALVAVIGAVGCTSTVDKDTDKATQSTSQSETAQSSAYKSYGDSETEDEARTKLSAEVEKGREILDSVQDPKDVVAYDNLGYAVENGESLLEPAALTDLMDRAGFHISLRTSAFTQSTPSEDRASFLDRDASETEAAA